MPYSKREITPEEACKDPNFYCELANLQVRLKHTHLYYHQVQLLLNVESDLYHWQWQIQGGSWGAMEPSFCQNAHIMTTLHDCIAVISCDTSYSVMQTS